MMLTVAFHNFMNTPVKNTSKSKILVKKLRPFRDFRTFFGYRITLFIPPLDSVENSGLQWTTNVMKPIFKSSQYNKTKTARTETRPAHSSCTQVCLAFQYTTQGTFLLAQQP